MFKLSQNMKILLPLIIGILLLSGFAINIASQDSTVSEVQPEEEEITYGEKSV